MLPPILTAWQDGLLKIQCQHWLVGDTLTGWGSILQGATHALNHRPMEEAFSHNQNLWV